MITHRTPLKKNVSYYTEKMRENIRRNINGYKWAREEKEKVIKRADEICLMGYDYLRSLFTTQDLPRSSYIRHPKGCLNCGFVTQYYKVDIENNDWKCVCPNCNAVFPTNDFASYYKSSLDENGSFVIGKGDKRYLKNIICPEKGESWGVDDGYGFTTDEGNIYSHVAYINCTRWATYIPRELLTPLCKAYLYTGEQKYADAAIILLDRASDIYPTLDIREYTPARGFYLQHGGEGQGKLAGRIEECIYLVPYITAYDLIFPAFGTMSEEARKFIFFRSKGEKNSYTDIMCNIEQGLILQILPAVKHAQMLGNNGLHQRTLGLAAVVLDHAEHTKEMLDFVFKTGEIKYDSRVDGGNVSNLLVRDVDRDGFGNEASPFYNSVWIEELLPLVKILDGYTISGTDISYDIFGNHKFKKMLTGMQKLIISGKYTPNVGDASHAGNPELFLNLETCVAAFKKYGDDIFAQSALTACKNDLDKLPRDLTDDDPESYIEHIKKIVEEKGTLRGNSNDLTGYGMGILQDGDTNGTALTMYYGRTTGHGHLNSLDLGLYAFGLNLSPDLGTPEYKDAFDMMRKYFVHHTVSHNTVMVNDREQKGIWSGRSLHFDSGEFVKLVNSEAPNVYEEVLDYKRTSALIKVNESRSYGVDFFSVKGGNNHKYIFHSAESASYACEGLDMLHQKNESGEYVGTMLSHNVEWGAVNDPSGYQYFTKVRRGNFRKEGFMIDWALKDTWGASEVENVHLRMHMTGGYGGVTLAVGTPPRNKPGNPSELEYVFVENKCDSGDLSSLFTAVFEPYTDNEPFIESIERAAVELDSCVIDDDTVIALKIKLNNGRCDVVVYNDSNDHTKEYIIDGKYSFRGFFAVFSQDNKGKLSIYANDCSSVNGKDIISHLTGTVLSFTKELTDKNFIRVKFNNAEKVTPEMLSGRYLYVKNNSPKNPCYKILSAQFCKDHFELDIGDVTAISSYKDPYDFSKGYNYDISENDTFSIPLSYMI
ncbi:MAG: hypothetical protein E7665_02720 [Ruminococcaceae bacterium]|nr:hypothetical protein [Oscillospiraceae bacterium]